MSQEKKSRGNYKIFCVNKNENTTFQNIEDAANSVLEEKLIAVNAYT